ncbi:MAG: hotdog fold thioesterase [Ferruginibacter sp.]
MALQNNNIWFNKNLQFSDLKKLTPATMGAYLGMEWVDIGADFLRLKMPVDDRTRQPYGLLHGGASCALAETVGSIASHLVMDAEKYICVGLEINANHLRSVRDGFVTGTATSLHIGHTTHVWDIKIHDDSDKLICISRLTVAILQKK